VGSATEYDQPPALEAASTALDVDEALWFDNGNLDGIFKDAHYEPQFDKFYLTQSRTHGNESSLIIVSTDGVDGMSPTIEWASKQFSIDNGLDGNTSPDPDFGGGLQDIFRSIGSVTISPDGSTLYAHRAEQFNADDDGTPEEPGPGNNPVLGEESNAPGSILIIPLDENGLPDLEIDNNGTPDDTSDDFLANVDSIPIEDQLVRHVRAPIALDAAGNVYITSNISELMQVFSPGGHTLAVTGSDGTFSVAEIGAGTPGDYNGDGVVDAADFTLWRDNLGGDSSVLSNNEIPGTVTAAHYVQWKSNFGATAPSASLDRQAVPEPTALALLGTSLLASIGWRRVRRKSV